MKEVERPIPEADSHKKAPVEGWSILLLVFLLSNPRSVAMSCFYPFLV